MAIRLLYSVTSTGIYEVTGETSEIGRYAAHLRVLDYMEHPICLRPAVLSRDSAGPIQAILTLYDTVVPPETDKQVIQPLDMAFLKYGGTFSAKRWGENVVDLTAALEASISGTDKTDISLRVCTRAAPLFATDDDNPSVIFGDLKILYGLRSNLESSRVGSWRGSRRLRFQLPPVKPCMWFSHTRLSDIVHRQACAVRW